MSKAKWCLPSTKLYPIRDKSINILWASSGLVNRSANISAVGFLYNFARPEVTTSYAHKKTVSICLTDPKASPVVASMNPIMGIVIPQSYKVDCSPSQWHNPLTNP